MTTSMNYKYKKNRTASNYKASHLFINHFEIEVPNYQYIKIQNTYFKKYKKLFSAHSR